MFVGGEIHVSPRLNVAVHEGNAAPVVVAAGRLLFDGVNGPELLRVGGKRHHIGAVAASGDLGWNLRHANVAGEPNLAAPADFTQPAAAGDIAVAVHAVSNNGRQTRDVGLAFDRAITLDFASKGGPKLRIRNRWAPPDATILVRRQILLVGDDAIPPVSRVVWVNWVVPRASTVQRRQLLIVVPGV